MIKYSVAFDGISPCGATVFNESSYSNEDNAFPKAIERHVIQHPDSANIYIVDRRLQSARNMKSFSENEVKFVCRLKEKRRYKELDTFIIGKTNNPLLPNKKHINILKH